MLSLTLLVAALAAAQDPVAEGAPPTAAPADGPVVVTTAAPTRSTSSAFVGTRFDARKRAEEACSFASNAGGLSCSKERMKWFNIVEDVDVDAPEGMVVRARLVSIKGKQCDGGIQISMTHKSKGITVDWASSTMDVDRRAVPLLPGFARRATAALAQRTSTAAPDTILEEIVVADAEDGTCLVKLEQGTTSTTLRVRLTLVLDGVTDSLTVVDTLRWQSVDDRGLFDALGRQLVDPPADRPLTATLVGAGAGAAVTIPTAALVGVAAGNANGLGTGILVGLGVAAAYGVICIGPCAGAGFLLSDSKAWKQADEQDEVRARAEAINARRIELGLDAPQAH